MLSPLAVSHVRRAVRAALAVEGGPGDGAGDGPGDGPGDGSAAWSWRGQVPEADFADAVSRHRVALLLADHADALALPDPLRRAVLRERDDERLGALSQIRLLAAVDGLLAGIPHLFFKGAALATLTTGDPAARGEGDVDVLVPPDRLGEAATAIGAAGWEVRPTYTTDQRSWAWRYQRWGAHEMAFDRDGETVDLHWRLGPTYDGLPAFDELWARRLPVKAGPVEVDTLGVADTFAHSLHHAAKDGWESLRSLVDVHRLARHPATPREVTDAAGVETLSAVRAAIGLPAGAPRFTPTRAPLPRMLAAQAAPVRHAVVPGQRTWRQAAFRWRTSRSPRDVALNAVTLLLPPASTVAISEPRALPALGQAVARRAGQVGWKLSGWRTEL